MFASLATKAIFFNDNFYISDAKWTRFYQHISSETFSPLKDIFIGRDFIYIMYWVRLGYLKALNICFVENL